MKILAISLFAFSLMLHTENQQSQQFPNNLTHSPYAPFARKLCDKCPEPVSMIQLIATPERFDGHLVRIEGYSSLQFEEYAIYLSRTDYEDFNTNNSLWISFAESTIKSGKELKGFQGKLVLLEGTFVADCHGHMGGFSGCMNDVKRIDSMLNRVELDRAVNGRGK
jgi:hypothetical protein